MILFEERIAVSEWTVIASVSELENVACHKVEIDGEDYVIVKSGDGVFVLEDCCSHSGAPLSEGDVVGDEIVCPWHGARFKLADGSLCAGPGRGGLKTLTARIEGDQVLVSL